MDSRTGAFFNGGGDSATPLAAGSFVILALVGLWALRRFHFSVSGSAGI